MELIISDTEFCVLQADTCLTLPPHNTDIITSARITGAGGAGHFYFASPP